MAISLGLFLSVATIAQNPCDAAITVNGSDDFCLGETRVLTASAGTVFVWNTGETTQSIVVSQGGLYTVSVTDADGCVAEAQRTMIGLPVPAGQAFPTEQPPFCSGDVITLVALGTPFVDDFLWSTGQTTPAIEVTQNGLYSVVVTNLFGCSAEAFVPVGFVPSPVAVVLTPGGVTACDGDELVLSATPSFGSSFAWSGGQSGPSISVSQSGSYTVTATNLAGCSTESEPVAVSFSTVPVIRAGDDVAVCEGEAVTLMASAAEAVLWSPGDLTDMEITVSPFVSTVYVVTATGSGCGQGLTDTVVVTVNPNPEPDFSHVGNVSGAPVVFSDESLAAPPVSSWVWDFGDGQVSLSQNPVYTYAGQADSYVVTLTVSTSAGCMDAISKEVTLSDAVVRSDVMTPNGDGVNDLILFSDSRARWLDISVYNRWGHDVWTSKGQELRFTGRTSAGVRLPAGTYFYVLATEFTDGNSDAQTGTITILGDQGF